MEKTYLNTSEKLNLKEEYKKSAGKKVPHDFFIYSCMAEDHTLQTLGDSSLSNLRWPVLAERRETGKLDDPLPEKSFEESVQILIQWYGNTYPELTGSQALDHALCSLLVGKFILMINDIRQLVFIKNNKGLPQIPSNEARPEIWDSLESLLNETFPTYTPYLMAYFKWVYAKPVERKLELSDLPPVGRYFNILKDNLRSKERGEEEAPSSSSFSAPSHSVPSQSNEMTPRKREWDKDQERPERTEFKEKEVPIEKHRDRPERTDREPRREREPRENRGRERNSDRDDEKGGKKDKEKLALLEVDKAVLAMKKHSSMTEFRLRPQNSFIRRLQHRKVNALGFQSHSVGEDDDRAVLITREE